MVHVYRVFERCGLHQKFRHVDDIITHVTHMTHYLYRAIYILYTRTYVPTLYITQMYVYSAAIN